MLRTEPAVRAAVGLQQLAGPRHPGSTAPMARRSVGRRRGPSLLVEETPQGPHRDGDVLMLLEQLREMGPVDVGVPIIHERQDAGPQVLVGAVRRSASAIAVDQGGWSGSQPRRQQTTDLATRDHEKGRGLVEIDRAVPQVRQDIDPVADLRVIERVIGGFHTRDRDKVAGRSSRT
jgi:hypothetical protein